MRQRKSRSASPEAVETAAALVARGGLTETEIASRCGVVRQTLTRWKSDGPFRALVEKNKAKLAAVIERASIADRAFRVATLDRLHGKIVQAVEGQAEPNHNLLREIREYQRQAALELGQWNAEQGLRPGESRLTVTYDAIQAIQQSDPERWRRIEAAARRIAAEERLGLVATPSCNGSVE